MESLAQPQQQTRSHFRFGPAALALSPLSPPMVSVEVQGYVANAFMETKGWMVDMVGHSQFCLDAYTGGLLHDSDLAQLGNYPNGYGLHLVTKRAVVRAGARVSIEPTVAVPEADELANRLSQPLVDVPFAANLTLTCLNQGLLQESDVASLVAQGPDYANGLLVASENALGGLIAPEFRKSRVNVNGDVQSSVVRRTDIEGDRLVLSALDMDFIYLDLPKVIDESFAEVNVLLFKTLDALSYYGVPFHTPASWMGKNGQYGYYLGEVYDSLKDRISTFSRKELYDYFVDLNFDEVEFDACALGLEGEGPHDEEAIEHTVDLLFEMHDVETYFSFRLDHSEGSTDAHRKAEMQALVSQAQEVLASGSEHQALLVALCGALETCIDLADRHFHISEHDLTGSAEDGVGFFETICVVVDDRNGILFEEAASGFNSYAENCACISVGLPLDSESVVAQTTIPIMERTNHALAHLREIQIALEANQNAQQ